MGRGFQVWKFHLKISPWEEKPYLPRPYGPWEASFSSRGLIFEGEEISIPETRPIQKSYISSAQWYEKLSEIVAGFLFQILVHVDIQGPPLSEKCGLFAFLQECR
jgi:hypothetical protein